MSKHIEKYIISKVSLKPIECLTIFFLKKDHWSQKPIEKERTEITTKGKIIIIYYQKVQYKR